jgi:hypothetical protein
MPPSASAQDGRAPRHRHIRAQMKRQHTRRKTYRKNEQTETKLASYSQHVLSSTIPPPVAPPAAIRDLRFAACACRLNKTKFQERIPSTLAPQHLPRLCTNDKRHSDKQIMYQIVHPAKHSQWMPSDLLIAKKHKSVSILVLYSCQ